MMTDPIADMLTRIRNANKAGLDKCDIPASKIKANICRILKEEGYIKSFKIAAKSPSEIVIRVGLKEQIIFPEIDYDKIDKIRGMGISFVTTATNNEEGRELLKQFGMPFREK